MTALAPLGEPTLVTDRVYGAIREAIRSGEIGAGERLRLRDLAARLGTSPMPVREAIGRLEQNGLVVRVPHRGAVVADLTPTELAHVYATRLLLEVEATRLGCAAVTPEDVGRMRAAYDRMREAVEDGRTGEALDADEELLSVLYAAGGNPVLLGLVADLWQRCRAFKLLGADGAASGGPDDGAWATQRRLLEAVEAHDVEAAVAVTRESLESARRRIRALLAGADVEPLTPPAER
ncbi:DNA-binding transcriptional regulator, GntR family [Microlunatus sagamiharensis]|uniref:DNA-binding transcriptional regulator, GntR family n=1 Tax=Microlunatus sagamiharensis TaxID=546874 RepID=A0A1H2MP47_9ACTN|nr:GntR family transcriptional regulator [Microlunatus sagamiharensis]SDU94765.1 DNA-binding transcriptional regulator, GntR family [Microlunatus sagamiharensis]